MAVIVLKMTDAGLAAVQAASGTDPVEITELGLTATAFDYAPTLTALPGEFKRLDVASGVATAPNVTHLTAYDTSGDTWTATGLGLFLADGTLFAVHPSADPIMTKVALAFGLLAFDIAFEADLAANIAYGNAVFTYPAATEESQGVAEIATQGEVNAGTDDQRIVTPLKLAALLAALLGPVTAAIGSLTASLAALLTDVWRPSNDGAGSGLDADLLDGRHGAWYAPAGQVAAFAMAVAPAGWLACNGAAVSRETYAALFSAISTEWGGGDGSTTFNLPDLRGEFLRGWDDGRGIDADRDFASFQADELKEHAHGLKNLDRTLRQPRRQRGE
ncbi:tail fiber protein [Novosphingobium colocasiae]